MAKLDAMKQLLGAGGSASGDSTLAKKKVMTQEEGRLADLAAMSGKKKALTKEQIDSAAGKLDRKTWVGAIKSVGYVPAKGN
jgi:predicted kinase